MFGRRSHLRFTINPASDGRLALLTDVVIESAGKDEVVAISREPGVVGELLGMHVVQAAGAVKRAMQVAESRPILTDGAVRHRLRLKAVESTQHEPRQERA